MSFYFEVEKVIDKRIRNGEVEFLIQWKDFPEEEDFTWQSVNTLPQTPEFNKLVEEFEARPKEAGTTEPPLDIRDDAIGFDAGFEPGHIFGVVRENDKLMFFMRFKGTDKMGFVPAEEANIICPQIVIQFYENRLVWNKDFQ